jgi:hypothetical protein
METDKQGCSSFARYRCVRRQAQEFSFAEFNDSRSKSTQLSVIPQNIFKNLKRLRPVDHYLYVTQTLTSVRIAPVCVHFGAWHFVVQQQPSKLRQALPTHKANEKRCTQQ